MITAAEVATELKQEFAIILEPETLAFWLRRWRLKVKRREREFPPLKLTTKEIKYLKSELARVAVWRGEEPKEAKEEKRPINSNLMQRLENEQFRLMAIDNLKDGGYAQTVLANDNEVHPATIGRWIAKFRREAAADLD